MRPVGVALAMLVVLIAVIALVHGRRPRVLIGTVLLFGTILAWALGGNWTVDWLSAHEGLGLAGALALVVVSVAVPAFTPGAARDAGSDSTARSPSPSVRSPETP